jgi:DNA-binding GntR family transcriptional regulator
MQVRRHIEVSATRELSRDPARMLVVRALDRCVVKMEQLLPSLENNKDSELRKQMRALDFEFHTNLIRSNDNIILNSIYETLSPQLYNAMENLPESFTETKKKINEYRVSVWRL